MRFQKCDFLDKMWIFAPVWILCRILKAVKKVLNKGGFKKSDVSIISAFTIRQTPVESRDLNSPSSRWWEVDRGAFFATNTKILHSIEPPIIIAVERCRFYSPQSPTSTSICTWMFFPMNIPSSSKYLEREWHEIWNHQSMIFMMLALQLQWHS